MNRQDAKAPRDNPGEYRPTKEELVAIDDAERSGIANDTDVKTAFRAFFRRKSTGP
jgi:hypothetical protein